MGDTHLQAYVGEQIMQSGACNLTSTWAKSVMVRCQGAIGSFGSDFHGASPVAGHTPPVFNAVNCKQRFISLG